MSRWSEQEIFEMTKLIEKSLQLILIQMGVKNEHVPIVSRMLMASSRGRITELLNKRLGGLLSPEEIAHMVAVNNKDIISKYDDKACGYSEVAATTA